MNLFLRKIIFYCAVLFIVAFAFESFIDHRLKNTYNYTYGDWNRIFKGQIDADIVILGSSRAFVQYNPQIIEKITGLKCYNLGLDGAGTTIQMAKWKAYLKYNKHPKFVIQDIDLLSFGEMKGNEIPNKEQFLPYLESSSVYNVLRTISPNIVFEKHIPLIKYCGFNKQVVSAFIADSIVSDGKTKGFQVQDKLWDDKMLDYLKTNKKKVTKEKKLLDLGFNNLISLALDCSENGIQLFLVHSPLFYEGQKVLGQQESFIVKISDFAKEYKITFWDFTEGEINYKTDYFYNATHLNKFGSDLFTKQISYKLNSISNKRIEFIKETKY